MYIILSSFEINPDHCQDFIDAALQNSSNSRLHEPGTLRFELLHDEKNPNLFYLSEAYEDEAAFEAHKKGAYFNAFFDAISGYSTSTRELVKTLISTSDEKNLTAVYEQLCDSYRAIDEFRTKLLGFLPLATGGGIFLLLGPLGSFAKGYLGPIGAFGFAITFGLFCYELYGIKKCTHLISAGRQIEAQLGIDGQYRERPRGVAGFINEPFADGIIYPAVGAAWMFLALAFPWPHDAGTTYAFWFAIGIFLVGLAVSVSYTFWLTQWLKKKASLLPITEDGKSRVKQSRRNTGSSRTP